MLLLVVQVSSILPITYITIFSETRVLPLKCAAKVFFKWTETDVQIVRKLFVYLPFFVHECCISINKELSGSA